MFAVFTSCSGDNVNDIVDNSTKASAVVETEEATDEPTVDGVNVEITDSASYTINEMADKIFGPEEPTQAVTSSSIASSSLTRHTQRRRNSRRNTEPTTA